MKFSNLLLYCGFGLFFVSLTFGQTPTVTVIPTLAPNADGSLNWPAWEANAVSALENNLPSYGDPTSPSYYQAQSTVYAPQSIVTGFPSWLGSADPGDVYGPAYAAEYGNRLTFGLVINGNGTPFTISELGFSAASNDAGNGLGFSYGAATDSMVGDGNGYNYSTNYVGVISSDGNIYDLAHDTFITSGPDTQVVDGIFGRGSGNSFEPGDDPCAGCTLAQQQADIDYTTNEDIYSQDLTQFTGTYYLTSEGSEADAFASGNGTFNITSTPEPSTWMMMLGALPALAIFRRRASNRS